MLFRSFHRSYKTFITKGLVRETEGFTDFTEATGTTLAQGIDFGPDQGLEELNVLFWSNNSSNFPDFHIAAEGETGPNVPAGLTGNQYTTAIGYIPSFIPWDPLRRRYPTAGWPDGIEVKTMERDDTLGSTLQLVRLRAGASIPTFRINGATHFFVVQGSITLDVPGIGIVAMKAGEYAFLPFGMALAAANPRIR